jgi:hypothetical protein
MTVCPACGELNPARASFCLACGMPLPSPDLSVRPARKTVTVVFTDVAESSGLGERLDPESLALVMASWFDHLRALFERHGGRVQKFVGDAVVAVFGIPAVNEDDALRAVRAAAELRASLGELNKELERDWGVRLHARSGVNTGEVVTARALAAEGRLEAATRLAGEAVAIAGPTDMLAMRGDALLDLAAVALAAGRHDDAAAAADAALELHLAKGNLPGATRAGAAAAAARQPAPSRTADA